LFVIAGPFDDIRNEYESYEDILWINLPETYFAEDSVLPYKTQTFMLVASTIPKLTYAMKTDDDSFIFTSKLKKTLSGKHFEYWGAVHRNVSPIRNPSNKWSVSKEIYARNEYPNYCSGAGYALSKAFLTCAVPKLADFTFMPREDVATGLLAESCGISPTTVSSIDTGGRKEVSDTTVLKHYVKTEKEMQSLHSGS